MKVDNEVVVNIFQLMNKVHVLIKQSSYLRSVFYNEMETGKMLRFVCVEVLRLSQPIGVMSSAVSLPNHTFTGQA